MTASESIFRNADNLSSDGSNFSGALISQEGAGGELTTDGDYYREYNALHQLIRIRQKTATGKIIEEYSYGPDGERIMTVRVENGQNTTIYTPFREWMMIQNATGTYNYTYVYDGNVLVAKINPDGTKWFYHDDHLGSTSLITDENGTIVEETFYNPFGQVTSGGEREAYLLYTNQMKDAIGCYDYGARVYCPKWYHFTSADPITANVFDPQGLNRFAYVRNNPYKYVDPDGKAIQGIAVIYWGVELIAAGGLFVGSVIESNNIREDSANQQSIEDLPSEYKHNIMHAKFNLKFDGEFSVIYKENGEKKTGTIVPAQYQQPDPRLNPKEDQKQELDDSTSPKSTYEELGDQSRPNEQRINVDGALDRETTVPSTPVEQTDKEEKASKGLLNIESDPGDSWKVVKGRKSPSDDKDSSASSTKTGDGGSGSKYNKNEKNKGKRGGR